MNIELSDLAAARLAMILQQESTEEPLAVRVIPLTSGCATPSFAIEITESLPHYEKGSAKAIPFVWEPEEAAWMDGLIIDLNRENGKFTIYHPHPPFRSDCQLENE
ncbi:hypothetical protein IC620_10045 [Hazenella sp. IB182357]|uniref:FeS cluster biogenesis domain-containing protein n=1 Tax=Polycladospora coralii TaxID=2771432 RepID=A0A926N9K5_9BACL|nr:hypothetical protein [Polycladospora coralii]MBD1372696.1 hypothetical protein [Polycladospora coralii]MBS7531090.1 hypothetical protein [Polycladospora coralii]